MFGLPNTIYLSDDSPELITLTKRLEGKDPIQSVSEVLNFVSNNIKYQWDRDRFVVPDFWKWPSATLKDKAGDCEDSSFLMTNLLERMNIPAATGFNALHAWTESDNHILDATYENPKKGFIQSDRRGEYGLLYAPLFYLTKNGIIPVFNPTALLTMFGIK